MPGFRWAKAAWRGSARMSLVAPLVALALAVLFDRGPSGEARFSPHLFPLALLVFDDFAWTCVRNSLIFALTVSAISVIVGVGLGWTVARPRFWGSALLRGGL